MKPLLICFFLGIVILSCDTKQSQDKRRYERFKTVVVNLRQVGFFEEHQNLSDDQLINFLMDQARENQQYGEYNDFEEVFDPVNNADFFELRVAALDNSRVWWHDLEADVLNGNNVYAQTVEQFVKLSGGYLHAANITEEWASDDGPVKISFRDNKTLRVFNLQSESDWYDTDFFKYIEACMKGNGSPYQLYFHDQTGQDVFLVWLTEAEKEKVEEKMNWTLAKF